MARTMRCVTNQHLFLVAVSIVLLELAVGDPRIKTVRLTCSEVPGHNTSLFVPNFVAAMQNISSQIGTSGFGLATMGSGPDASNILSQCYGDLSLLDCVLCYAEARSALPQCYPYNSGRIYLDGCFMRGENYSFFQEYTGPQDTVVCGNFTRKNTTFHDSVRQAVARAVVRAPNNKGYARAKVAVLGTANESAYLLANCWRTLNTTSCRACLENASTSILRCLPRSEGRALNTGCFMRYSDTNFLNKEPGKGSKKGTIAAITVPVVSALVVLAVGITMAYFVWKHEYIQKKRKGSNDADNFAKLLRDKSLNFKYSTLEKATVSFDSANKLGQGGFGSIYKGVLPDGREIAVKRLFFNSRHTAADFYNEVNIMSSVEHKNLVRLLGCSFSGPESLLVYELLPNKSLNSFIFDTNRGKALNWEKRVDIMVGTAEGLVYLHESSKIIHRDIKPSNILLDSRLRAKIADFGLARSFQEDNSHISTTIAGTLGYMAPEYLVHGLLTEKVDVYSYGVLMLETVTGRQNNKRKTSEYSDSLIKIAWNHFQANRLEELFDPNLMLHNYPDGNIKNEVSRVIHIGLLCMQEASLRPKMSKALQMLTKKDEDLPPPTSPPFFINERTMMLNDPCGESPSFPPTPQSLDSIATISDSSFQAR
ncbi:hypothetical protein BT93_H1689 [Corymbia citriodora subsp. variegata]|nr:hypothetical protein BT93_H1689 [Corymbia citriodora subsp. variegata]